MVSLVGRNGAGKTTLMRSIMGHLNPAQGTISVSKGSTCLRAHVMPARSRDRLYAGRPLFGPQLTSGEHPVAAVVADHLDRKARLDFVYE